MLPDWHFALNQPRLRNTRHGTRSTARCHGIPLIVGQALLRGERGGLYAREQELILLVVTIQVIFLALLDWENASIQAGRAVKARTRKQKLPRSEAVQRSLFEYLPDAMLVSDRKGRIVRVNSQAEALFGYAREELIGQSIDLLVPHRHRKSHAGRRAGYYAAPQIRPMGIGKDLYARRKDGNNVPVDISLSHSTQDGELLVIAIIRDLTHHKRLEAAFRESQRALSTLMSNLPGMAYRCKNDRDRTLEFAGDGCVDLTGYAAADFVQNRKVSFGDLIHPDDRDKVWDDVQSALREKMPFHLTYRIATSLGSCTTTLASHLSASSSIWRCSSTGKRTRPGPLLPFR